MVPDRGVVVAAVDGRPGSAGALRYAVAEARRRHALLRLVHVLPDVEAGAPSGDPPGHGAGSHPVLEQARETALRLDGELDVSTTTARGDRSAAIVRAGEDAELVVIGREERRGADGVPAATTTAEVAAHCRGDVAVVPSFWVDRSPRGRVVVGVERGDDTDEMMSAAFAAASSRGAVLVAAMAWQVADPRLDRLEEGLGVADHERTGLIALEEAVADGRTAYPTVPVEVLVAHGEPGSVLLQASGVSDLLVIARRRASVPSHGRLGGVGHSLLRLSDVPVLVVPPTPDVADRPSGPRPDIDQSDVPRRA